MVTQSPFSLLSDALGKLGDQLKAPAWLNYLRVAYPEAEQAFDALRVVNDPDAIGAWVLRIQELPAHVQQAPAAKITV